MFYKFLLIVALGYAVEGVERPKGVSPSKASLYQEGKDFVCLTSGETVAWDSVNDDYCDCKDGSDEPGTSACENGSFFCENRGHRGSYIISSRVNDGICDCCDGSDEYELRITCVNTCDEMGRKEREERERFKQLQEQGYRVKQEYMQQGKRTKDAKRGRLSELEKQVSELKVVREGLLLKKEEVEGPEKEAKEQHQKAWDEQKAEKQAEKDRAAATVVFAEVDANSDNIVDYVEMQRHLEFDIDSDGTVSIEEAREYLNDNDEVDLETFQGKIYSNIKDIYKSPSKAPEELLPDDHTAVPTPSSQGNVPPPKSPPSPDSPTDGSDFDDDFEDDEDDYDREYDEEDEEDEDDEEEEARGEEEKPKNEEDPMPPYSAETQKLIDDADAARSEYNEADNKVRDAENEINGLKQYLEVDYGPDEEFSSLRGQCFEFTDREYTYKLCPFDKAVQKPKSGGIETSLGKWGHWYGPEEDRYDAMKYENGQNCWNGPNRSCHVNLHCGTENKLTGASEPSRCEYQFEFSTPARCRPPQENQDVHDEL